MILSLIIQVSPGCRIINETVMFCRAPPVNTANIPTTAQFDVKNHFGIISLTGNLTLEILEDPVISNFTPSILTNELTHIHIMVSLDLFFILPIRKKKLMLKRRRPSASSLWFGLHYENMPMQYTEVF